MLWTIDTWVLCRANEEEDASEDCRNFLKFLLDAGDNFVLNDEVKREYEKKAFVYSTYSYRWFYEKAWNHGKCVYDPAHQTDRPDALALRQRLAGQVPTPSQRFDPDDVPFVVLCFCTDDRHLISGDVEEGDFSPALTEWLRDEYEICFHELAGDQPYHRARHVCTRPAKA